MNGKGFIEEWVMEQMWRVHRLKKKKKKLTKKVVMNHRAHVRV